MWTKSLTNYHETATLFWDRLLGGKMPDFMPVLSPEEITKRRSARGTRVDLAPYMDYLRKIRPGFAGEVQLRTDESKPTIKRRITMAATRLGKNVKYLRSSDDRLIFEVLKENNA